MKSLNVFFVFVCFLFKDLQGFAADLSFKPEFVALPVILLKSQPFPEVKREDIFITTKIPGPIGSDAVQKMVLDETLPKLGVEYVIQMQFLSLILIIMYCRNLQTQLGVIVCRCIQRAILEFSFLTRLVLLHLLSDWLTLR